MTILVTVFVFGLIILVHELGHFFVAKLMGVKVNEFAMGMGPKLVRIQGKETLYSIRAFPVGGFCAMEGEDEESGDPRAFGSKKVWKRILIIVAGAAMNLILGFALLLVYCSVLTNAPTTRPYNKYLTTTVSGFTEDAKSSQTGLQIGDEILKINDKSTINFAEILVIMGSDEDGIFDMTVRRSGQKVELKNVQLARYKTEEFINDKGETEKREVISEDGTPFRDFEIIRKNKTVLSTLEESVKMELMVGRLVWRSLVDIVTGKFGLNDLTGPIGVGGVVGNTIGEAIKTQDWGQLANLLFLVILLTVNVGIFNLLPLPALDGGRLIFLLFEAIFRRPVNPKYEGIVHAVGLILLLLLMAVVAFSDIARLITGG